VLQLATIEQTAILKVAFVDKAADLYGFAAKLVEAELAEVEDDGRVHILGAEERIAWYLRLRAGAQKGGAANRARLRAAQPLAQPSAQPLAQPSAQPLAQPSAQPSAQSSARASGSSSGGGAGAAGSSPLAATPNPGGGAGAAGSSPLAATPNPGGGAGAAGSSPLAATPNPASPPPPLAPATTNPADAASPPAKGKTRKLPDAKTDPLPDGVIAFQRAFAAGFRARTGTESSEAFNRKILAEDVAPLLERLGPAEVLRRLEVYFESDPPKARAWITTGGLSVRAFCRHVDLLAVAAVGGATGYARPGTASDFAAYGKSGDVR
jgi:hypothetical protein